MTREISAPRVDVTLLDFYMKLRDFPATLDFVRIILQIVECSDVKGMNYGKLELYDLVTEGDAISKKSVSCSANQRTQFIIKVVKRLNLLKSLLCFRPADQGFDSSINKGWATNLLENSSKMMMIQTLQMITDEHMKMLIMIFETLVRMEDDAKRFGFKGNNCSLSEKLFSGVIILDRPPLVGLLEMISSHQIINFCGPPLCGKTHIVQELLEDSKLREAYGDNIYYLNVKETLNKKNFTSKLLALLNNKGEVEGIDINALKDLIKSNGPKMLIFDDFPPEWETFIEELGFPNAACKLLVVSRTKLSRFDAYGLDNMYDVGGRKFHVYSSDLAKNPYIFDDVETRCHRLIVYMSDSPSSY